MDRREHVRSVDRQCLLATLVAAGTYSFIYTVPGSGPCTADDATVTVEVSPGGDPGIGGTDTICGGLNAYDLFNSLSGTPDAGGTWADVLSLGALTDNFLNASLLPSTGQYPFTYTVTVPGCGDATSLVYISVTPFPDPGGEYNARRLQLLGNVRSVHGAWRHA